MTPKQLESAGECEDIIEAMARALDPGLWKMIDQHLTEDDGGWNTGAALNARDTSLKRARAALAVLKARGWKKT